MDQYIYHKYNDTWANVFKIFQKCPSFIYRLFLVRMPNMKVKDGGRCQHKVVETIMIRSLSGVRKTFGLPVTDKNSVQIRHVRLKSIVNCAMLIWNIMKSIWTCSNTVTNWINFKSFFMFSSSFSSQMRKFYLWK